MVLSPIVIADKNSLVSKDPILLMLELSVPSLVDPIRLTRNNEDITWGGGIWQAFPFEIDDIAETADGEIPQVSIRLANASRVIERYLIDYDNWLKLNVHRPIIATLSVVATADILNPVPVKAISFEVSSFTSTAKEVVFNLTQKNIYGVSFPPSRIIRRCRWKFGSIQCGVVPLAGQTCNKTLTDCRSYNNSGRFGGFPSVGGLLERVPNE